MVKKEIVDFLRGMKTGDHVILFYYEPEDKAQVLFTYLKAGLDHGEAAAYIAGQVSRDEIRDGMRSFGIDVEELERSGALRVIDYKDWYIIGGKFNPSKTMELWKKLWDESSAKGFAGLRIAGEMACFFENGMVKELVEYERSLHRVLKLPMSAICAYDSKVVADKGVRDLYLDLIKAHGTVIVMGRESGMISVNASSNAQLLMLAMQLERLRSILAQH